MSDDNITRNDILDLIEYINFVYGDGNTDKNKQKIISYIEKVFLKKQIKIYSIKSQ